MVIKSEKVEYSESSCFSCFVLHSYDLKEVPSVVATKTAFASICCCFNKIVGFYIIFLNSFLDQKEF